MALLIKEMRLKYEFRGFNTHYEMKRNEIKNNSKKFYPNFESSRIVWMCGFSSGESVDPVLNNYSFWKYRKNKLPLATLKVKKKTT